MIAEPQVCRTAVIPILRGMASIAGEHGLDKARAIWAMARDSRSYIEHLVISLAPTCPPLRPLAP
jgi:hypothetical protein